jgi:hypothetical protein
LEDTDVDGRIILKLILNRVGGCLLNLSGSGYEPLASCCENVKEPSDSIKDGEFIGQLRDLSAFQMGLFLHGESYVGTIFCPVIFSVILPNPIFDVLTSGNGPLKLNGESFCSLPLALSCLYLFTSCLLYAFPVHFSL